MSNVRAVVSWRIRTKTNLLKGFRSKCAICSYDKCQNALELHHLDPSEKEFGFGSKSSISWDKLINEAKKCICVCANCHREIHAGLVAVSEDHQRFDESLLTYQKHSTLKGNRNASKNDLGGQDGIRTHDVVSYLD